jgi:integrase
MDAVARLDDVYPRCAITILRGTGLRIGELLDLEVDCLWDLTGHGTWLKVPLGKLNTERVVPLDEPTLAVFDTWTAPPRSPTGAATTPLRPAPPTSSSPPPAGG